MKLLSLFSGIGAFEKALDRLQVPYELVGYCEIDKYASKSYAAIHGVSESMNIGDITKVDEKELPKDIDLITYGFPCQDISLAGKQKGLFNEDGSQTRSGLFFEALRIIEETHPMVAIAENVKNLTSKKFNAQFQIVLASLEAAGYNNYFKVLNAKDFGVPQNRERVFIVSIRKDIDTGAFKFPEGFPLELRLKDVLEDAVDEKFYLSKDATKLLNCNAPSEESVIKVGNVNPSGKGMNGTVIDSEGLARTITQEKGEGQKILVREESGFIAIDRETSNGELKTCHIDMEDGEEKDQAKKLGNVYDDRFNGGGDFGGNVWDTNGLAPTLKTSAAASQQFVMVREATSKGYAEAYEGDSINLEQPNSQTRMGRVGRQVAQTLTTSCNQAVVEPVCLNSKGGRAGIEGIQPSVQDRIYDSNAIAPAVTTAFMPSFAVDDPYIKRVDIPQVVSVRKYEVDTKSLCELLRESKSNTGISNKDISIALDVPVTMVEHWFRKDDCFAIPDSDIWMELKKLLQIETDEFDESIMTFEEREGVFEKSERHYMSDGIAPTLTRTTAAEKIIEPSLRIRKLTPKECFRLMDFDDEDFEKAEAVNSNTQLYKQAGNSIVVACPYYIFKALFDANILIEKEIKQMELKVSEYQLPEVISFNFEELKAELAEKVGIYETMVYTDDQIKVAKADKANLNKLKKALNDERIRREKEYMIPFNAFKAQVNEIIAIIDKPVAVIDQRVKEYEEIQKQKKLDAITSAFNVMGHPEWLHLSQIFDEKWLNASVSQNSVVSEISARIEKIYNDLSTLENLPEFGFEATEVYKTTLDINRALNEGHRMAEVAKAKAEAEARKVEPIHSDEEVEKSFIEDVEKVKDLLPEAPAKQWVRFQALMTIDQARELKKFFDDRNIEFKAV